MIKRAVWVALAVLFGGALYGCLGNQEIAAPSAGGGKWVELRSEHFSLVTDLSQRDGAKVISEYEHVYRLLATATNLAAAQRSLELPSFTTNAIAFRNYDEIRQFVPPRVAGQYRPSLPNEIEATPTMLVYGTVSPYGRALFAHELAHRFNAVTLGATPRWLNEGLAQYYETIRGTDAEPVIGESDPEYGVAAGSTRQSVGDIVYHGDLLHVAQLPSASELLRLEYDEFYARDPEQPDAPLSWQAAQTQARHYAASWLLVHLLFHEQTDYAVKFRALLSHPDMHSTGTALERLLLSVDSRRLDADLKAYGLKQIPWRQHHAGTSPLVEQSVRALEESEVLTWWARLDSFDGGTAKRALQRLEQAKTSNPRDAATWFWLGRYAARQGDLASAERHYAEAIALAPERPEFLLGPYTLYNTPDAQKLWSTSEREQRLNRVLTQLEPLAHSPQQLNLLAIAELRKRDFGRADQFAKRAADLGRDCWECRHTRAQAAFLAGDTARALEYEQSALALTSEDTSVQALIAMREGLRIYESVLRDPSAAGTGRQLPPLFVPN